MAKSSPYELFAIKVITTTVNDEIEFAWTGCNIFSTTEIEFVCAGCNMSRYSGSYLRNRNRMHGLPYEPGQQQLMTKSNPYDVPIAI